MKKALIAGASAAVLAAMPVVGVFATGSQEDTIQIGIDESCTIALNTNGHANGTDTVKGTWGTDSAANLLSGKVSNGTSSNDFGSSTMVISCNAHNGFEVTAEATALTASKVEVSSGVKATIPLNASFSSTTSGWAYKVSAVSDSSAITNNASSWTADATKVIVEGDSPISNGTFTATYGVGVSATQDADTYTGSITYTIASVTGA